MTPTPLPGSINNVFGSPIKPPGPVFDNPLVGLSKIVTTTISVFIIFAALAALLYLLWGAFSWVTSNGEQEALQKARLRMTHAVLGLVLIVAVLGIFTVITGDVLGVIRRDVDGNWSFVLPTVNSCVAQGQVCVPSSSVCCDNKSCINTTPTAGTAAGIYKCQ